VPEVVLDIVRSLSAACPRTQERGKGNEHPCPARYFNNRVMFQTPAAVTAGVRSARRTVPAPASSVSATAATAVPAKIAGPTSGENEPVRA
jgi:hypothetical protein